MDIESNVKVITAKKENENLKKIIERNLELLAKFELELQKRQHIIKNYANIKKKSNKKRKCKNVQNKDKPTFQCTTCYKARENLTNKIINVNFVAALKYRKYLMEINLFNGKFIEFSRISKHFLEFSGIF